jgi:hypothetical protein
MGFPTFTFETDDEQFLLGTTESLSDRLGEELEVMRYLIDDVWYWRARLVVNSIEINDQEVTFQIDNLGRATTRNATLNFIDSDNETLWQSENFTVNATNSTTIKADGFNPNKEGSWVLIYQKRIIDSSLFVSEPVDSNLVKITQSENENWLGTFDMSSLILVLLAAVYFRKP